MNARYSTKLIKWLLCSVATLSATALAHHSSSMWDDQRTMELHGTMKSFEWTNPHVWIWIISDENQQVWGIEAGAVNSMRRQGWSRDSLTVGEKVTVTIHSRRDGAKEVDAQMGSLMSIQKADGTPVPAKQ